MRTAPAKDLRVTKTLEAIDSSFRAMSHARLPFRLSTPLGR